LISTIWSYRLRRAADWAWGSVANADAPLAYELATALAGRGHLDISSLRNGNVVDREMQHGDSQAALGSPLTL